SAIYTLSLHDALPICSGNHGAKVGSIEDDRRASENAVEHRVEALAHPRPGRAHLKFENQNPVRLQQTLCFAKRLLGIDVVIHPRSEEHTSELQSRSDL